MELLEWIERIFSQYGYYVLLIGLPLDFIALPIPPAQTTITVTGYLVSIGVLKWLPAIVAAYIGSIIGITVTYTIGYQAGHPLLQRLLSRKGKKTAAIAKVEKWHKRYGHKMLLFSFFIPIVRQFYSYYMGIVRVPFYKFALFGYTGAAIWVLTFFMIGYSFAQQWQVILTLVSQNAQFVTALIVIVVASLLLHKYRMKLNPIIRNLPKREIELKLKPLKLFRTKIRNRK